MILFKLVIEMRGSLSVIYSPILQIVNLNNRESGGWTTRQHQLPLRQDKLKYDCGAGHREYVGL